MKVTNNIKLAIVLGLLIMISVTLELWETNTSSTGVNTELFVVDNIELVDRVVITNQTGTMDCRAFPGGFMINQRYPMDQGVLNILAAVFQQIRVQRPVSGPEQEEIVSMIRQTGSKVEVFQGENLLLSFWAGGDEAQQKSYFVTLQDEVYLVQLPGYSSYVSGLFQMPLSSWRSREVFQNSWRSLMSFSYQDFEQPTNDFQITYRDPFFAVSGVQQLDSNKVMNYLQDLISLKASSIIDTSYQGMPWLELSTVDLDPQKNLTLTLYGTQTDKVILGKAGEQHFLFSNTSLQPILRHAAYFERTKE